MSHFLKIYLQLIHFSVSYKYFVIPNQDTPEDIISII
jgi:hypothetical protein